MLMSPGTLIGYPSGNKFSAYGTPGFSLTAPVLAFASATDPDSDNTQDFDATFFEDIETKTVRLVGTFNATTVGTFDIDQSNVIDGTEAGNLAAAFTTGVIPNGDFAAKCRIEDGSGNALSDWSNTVTKEIAQDLPTLSSAVDAEDGQTAGTGSVSTDIVGGTLYAVITTSATTPTEAQIKAGQDHTGASAVDTASQAVSATGVNTITGGFTGLTAGTAYFAHYVQETVNGFSNAISGDGFTTQSSATQMYRPLLARGDNHATVVMYMGLENFGRSSGIDNDRATIAVDGEISNLYIKMDTAPDNGGGTQSVEVTLMVNGVASALTATISEAGTTANDTTHAVSVTAGDYVNWRITPTNTPAVSPVYVTAQFTSDDSSMYFSSYKGSGSTGNTRYYSLAGEGTAQATEANADGYFPCAGTLSLFNITRINNLGAGTTLTYTVYKNGSPTALTVSLTHPTQIATDAVNSLSVAAGDRITLEEVATTGSPNVANCNVSFKWVPDVAGEYPVGGTYGVLGSANTLYILPKFYGTASVTAYVFGHACAFSVSDVSFYLDVAPSAGKSRALKGYKASAQTLVATISDAATSASDTTNSDSISQGDAFMLQEVPTGTPTNNARTFYNCIFTMPLI